MIQWGVIYRFNADVGLGCGLLACLIARLHLH